MTTLDIYLPNVTTGPTGLAAPVDRLASVKALAGLQGLYMFEDGAVGSAYATAIDVSGNGNTGIARPAANGYVIPTRTALGLTIGVGDSTHSGAVFDTNIARTDNTTGFTVIYGWKTGALMTSNTGYPYTGIVDTSLRPLGNATVNTLATGPLVVARQQQYPSSSAFEGEALFDPNSSYPWLASQNLGVPPIANVQTSGAWDLAANVVDTVNKNYSVYKNGNVLSSAVAFKNGFTAPTTAQGNFCFGAWLAYAGGSYRPAGQLAFVVICTQPNTAAAIQAACAALTQVMAKRGATFGAQ